MAKIVSCSRLDSAFDCFVDIVAGDDSDMMACCRCCRSAIVAAVMKRSSLVSSRISTRWRRRATKAAMSWRTDDACISCSSYRSLPSHIRRRFDRYTHSLDTFNKAPWLNCYEFLLEKYTYISLFTILFALSIVWWAKNEFESPPTGAGGFCCEFRYIIPCTLLSMTQV